MPSWMTPTVGTAYLYFWRRMNRKGQRCVVFAWAPKWDTVGVEFDDGFQAVTSAKALRPLPAKYVGQDTLF